MNAIDPISVFDRIHYLLSNRYNIFEQLRMIIQTILEVQGNAYPFDEVISKGSKGMVQELELFQSKDQLAQRKNELKKNLKAIQSHFIIKLLKIYQQDLCLHYIYQYVPESLASYIQNQLQRNQCHKFKEMTAKLLFRKLTNDINTLVTELSKMRIQTQLSYQMLGVQADTIKLFIGSQFKVGRRSELLLKEQYKPPKEAILKAIEHQFSRIIGETSETPNFVIKGNRLLFSNNKRESLNLHSNCAPSIYSDENQSSFCLNDTYVNCQTKDSNMNQTKEKQRRYSQSKWQANQWRRHEKDQQRLRNTQSPAFINNLNLDTKSKMGGSRHFDDSINSQDGNFDRTSYCRSKSIRIELQKNKNRKHRKDSYKVKVITCHEYQMDDVDAKDLFSKCNISNSESEESDYLKNRSQHQSPKKKQFQQKVHKAAEKAKQILSGYIHRRRNSRK